MNVRVVTMWAGNRHTDSWVDAEVTYDGIVVQVAHGGETTTFPLTAVISYTLSESGPT